MSLEIEKWNKRHWSGYNTIPEPANVLKEYAYLLPEQGKALDLACGLGGNALYLAKKGLTVDAWDFSPVAIDVVNHHAKRENLSINAQVRDITIAPPQPDSFDVIIVSYFLDRTITHSLLAALKPGGLLFYQTFTRKKVSDTGPNNPAYLLKANELLALFKELEVRIYREEAFCGDTKKGLRNEALFIGEKIGQKPG